MLQHAHELIIGKHIQLLHLLTLHIYSTGITKYINQASFINLHIHALCSKTHITQQARKLTSCLRKIAELLNRKFIESKNLPVDDHKRPVCVVGKCKG